MSGELRQKIESEWDARRVVLESTRYAQDLGFDETSSRMIATAVSELARNIIKYARTGEIHLRPFVSPGHRGIEIEATDRGPGIEDTEAAMADHFSSQGTLGLGLPGVRRMMDEFFLDSTLGEGTRVTARKWK